MEIIRDLRRGDYDVLIGINLLREGLDIPEVALVAILDADKEGFLRSETSLIQTVGRAARNSESKVIMYADNMTKSMEKTINETNRRRSIQKKYNDDHNIVPKTIIKEIRDVIEISTVAEDEGSYTSEASSDLLLDKKELAKHITKLEKEMKEAAKDLQFERAAILRDEIERMKREFNL